MSININPLYEFCDARHGVSACEGCPLEEQGCELDGCEFSDWPTPELEKALKIVAETPREYTPRCIGEEQPGNVNHPKHYELPGGIECFDVILATQGREAAKAFCICNAIKYLFRHRNKNGVEDVKKAKWYIDKYLELEENK